MTPQNSDSKELALVDSGKVTKFTPEHAKEVGLPSPDAINFMVSVAKLLLESSLITGDMGNTPEKIKANALAKMLVGHEMQMQPMEALQDVDIVKGKIFVRYPQILNQMLLRGFNLKWEERSDKRAALLVTPPRGMEPELFEFTIEDAQRAGLLGYAESQYHKRPRVMLAARVISEAYRGTGGRSNVYTPEEKREIIQPEDAHRKDPEENPYFVGTKPAGEPDITTRQNATVNPGGESTPAQLEPSAPVEHARTAEASSKATDLPAPAERAGNGAAGEPQTVSSNTSATPSRPDLASGVPSPAPLASVGAPAAVVSTAKVVPIRITDATDKIAKLLPDPKQRDKVLNHFLGGFFNVSNAKKITKSDPRLVPALAILSALADKYMTQLMADPHGAGLMATAGWRGLEKYMDKLAWPEDCRELARAIALERYADTGGGDLLEYLEDPVKAHQMPMHELRTFLQVLARTRQALLLKDAAAGSTMSELVASWGLNLETCAEAEILAKLQRTQVDEPEPEQPDNLFEMFQEGVEDEQ